MPDFSVNPWPLRNSKLFSPAVHHELSIVKISWHIKILNCTFLWFHPEMKVGNELTTQNINKSPNTNTFHFSQAVFCICFFFLTFRMTIYLISTKLKRRQPISILFSQHFKLLRKVSVFLPLFPKISVFICRRRQLKESVYGDKLQQYNAGGGTTNY